MKSSFGIAVALLVYTGLLAQPKQEFRKKVHKYEKVEAGQLLSFDYLYTNTGNQPLLITDAKVACPCTKFRFSEKPLAPGATDTLHVEFDTARKYGWQDREVVVHSNASNSPQTVRFKGMVEGEPKK